MAKQSETGNVKKLCACGRPKWSACAHPWYVDYKAPKTHRRRPNERYRKNLDQMIGFHPESLTVAKEETRRAIVAWLDGKDPADLQAGDRPTLMQAITEYRKRPDAAIDEAAQIGPITRSRVQGRPFGEWRLAEITREALEGFQRSRPRVAGNRNLAFLRALFNWAVVAGLVEASPFRVGGVTVVKLRSETARSRRLAGDEEERLLMAAGGLHDLIVAALETGCRKGELLTLQWHQVRFAPRAEIFLPAQKTKAKKDRRVPLSGRLQRLLEKRKLDPAGDPLPPSAFVFGDEIGRRRAGFKRAWESIVLRASGHTPKYVKRAKDNPTAAKRPRLSTATLTAECRAALREIDLHFHDLRREAGSRWMDAGVPLATIQRWLGHHNISQTSTYLAASLGGDEAAIMAAFEQKMGRGPLPQIDISRGSNRDQPTQSDIGQSENAQQNANGPEPVTVH